ncbi:TonB-dependent receptor [Thermaurantimonas aggregans]|uniref:TonB-dependent receptor n=1 Tax=Thermaurantimonas aggregans TaxID=2173829 RepID=A0A401XJW3_9FLAO|nr:TonB-dependent receptor [Thermaurantimonas aggregans]MCX8148877.1 TonB-dependent receptor [Thermaurantimonas aggregans]GCD77306.1 TonB-dependent receptor [Thermaurantimonas aggregans]
MNGLNYILGAWLLSWALCSQHTYLPEVDVRASRIHLSTSGFMEFSPDSSLLKNKAFLEVTDLLRYSLPAVVRQYGPGMITTFRVRGLASEHFKVVWNGLSINNPAMGLFDFSGVPGFAFDQLSIYQGNMAGFYGSGAGSGALLLGSKPVAEAIEASAISSIGSFGYRQAGVMAGTNMGRFSTKISINQHLASNDFEYINLSRQRQRLSNGSYIHTNATLDFGYKIDERLRLHMAVWKQRSFINIPPSRVESRFNTSRQWNDNLRTVLLLTGRAGLVHYSTGVGYISEKIVYQNDLLRTTDSSEVKGVQTFFRGQTTFNKTWNVLFNTELSHYNAPSKLRAEGAQQTLAIASTTVEHWIHRKIRLALTARQEWMDGNWAPSVFRLSGEKFLNALKFSISAGNHFRWPTLNERFWTPGGNPDLQSESGYTAELGLRYRQKWKLLDVEINAQPFAQQINQLILWQPVGAFWSPINVQSAQSAGVEVRAESRVQLKDRNTVNFQINYCFNRTEITKAEGAMSSTVGKQLIYSPLHIANFSLGYTFNTWQYLASSHVQGAQHTLSDNHPSGLLKGFAVFNTLINKEITRKNFNLSIGIEVRNIFNTEYQMVAQRPMPGREYRLNLLIRYYQPKTRNL